VAEEWGAAELLLLEEDKDQLQEAKEVEMEEEKLADYAQVELPMDEESEKSCALCLPFI
jgi:hypothetical protein